MRQLFTLPRRTPSRAFTLRLDQAPIQMMALPLAALLALAVALGLPASPVRADVSGLNVVAPEEAFPSVSRSYRSMDARYSRTGFNRSLAQVREVGIGSTKAQLVSALGQPVSAASDGSWYFSLGLPLPQNNRLVCQYRVFFDAEERVSGTAWRRIQCANLVALSK